MMRALVVIDTLGIGGAERLLCTLLPALRERGVECTVAVLRGPDTLAHELESQDIRVVRLNVSNRWALHQSVRLVRRLAIGLRADVIWGHLYFANITATLAALSCGLPSVATLHGMPHDLPFRAVIRDEAYKLVERLVLARSNAIVAVSNTVAAHYRAQQGFSPSIVANGVDERTIPAGIASDERAALRREFGVADHEWLVVVPSRCIDVKGLHTVVDAAQNLRKHFDSARFVCVGGGPRLEALRSLARQRRVEDTVQFVGPLPQPKLFRLIAAADAVAMPSMREGLPLSAVEALAIGAPMILSRIPAFEEVIGDTSLTEWFTPLDGAGFAAAVVRLRNTDAATVTRRVDTARHRALRTFGRDALADRWARLLHSCQLPSGGVQHRWHSGR